MDYVGLNSWAAIFSCKCLFSISTGFDELFYNIKVDYKGCLIAWVMQGHISTCFPQINLCKFRTVSTWTVEALFLDLGSASLIRGSYHNYQGRWSYKTPNEVGVKSKPASAVKHKGEKPFKDWLQDIYHAWASDREECKWRSIPRGDRKYYIACSFKCWIMCPTSDNAIDGVR